jgi:hypothetical protein
LPSVITDCFQFGFHWRQNTERDNAFKKILELIETQQRASPVSSPQSSVERRPHHVNITEESPSPSPSPNTKLDAIIGLQNVLDITPDATPSPRNIIEELEPKEPQLLPDSP